jgi:putative endonuclease
MLPFFNTKKSSPTLGKQGEDAVASFLKKEGFTILATNYRKFFGEIDIIAQKHDVIAFVEVKTRQKSYFDLSRLVIVSKQRKIIKTAEAFIAEKKLSQKIFRFDVALLEKNINHSSLHYIPNAFCKPEYAALQ